LRTFSRWKSIKAGEYLVVLIFILVMMPYMIQFTVPTADTVGSTENGKFLLIKDYEKEKKCGSGSCF
jgi:hypothetical protein